MMVNDLHGFIERRRLKQELARAIHDPKIRENVCDIIDCMPDANLLERDKGKAPILESRVGTWHEIKADGTGGFKSKEFEDWMCPNCGWFVGELYSGHGMWHIQGDTSYCAKCGQRIDWTLPNAEEKRRYEERKAQEREAHEQKYGKRLDNMWQGKRIKYGIMEDK